MKIIALSLLIITSFAGLAYAESAAIAARKEVMSENGKGTKVLASYLKGEAPFDLATAKQVLTSYSTGATKFATLFPDDSKEGGKTEADAKIWAEKDKFVALVGKFGKDSAAAVGSITDLASFKAEMPKILGQCKECHDSYRVKK